MGTAGTAQGRRDSLQVGDKMVTACILLLVLLILFHASSLIIARRVFFVAGTLYGMRSISLIVTQLPTGLPPHCVQGVPGYVNSTTKCRPAEGNLSFAAFVGRVLEQTVNIGFQVADIVMAAREGACRRTTVAERFSVGTFSSRVTHSSSLPAVSSFTTIYRTTSSILSPDHASPRLLTLIPVAFAVFGMLCMIFCRTHYTIDVVFAYWLSTGVFTWDFSILSKTAADSTTATAS